MTLDRKFNIGMRDIYDTAKRECGRLDISVEALALRDEFKELFTEEERKMCRERLLKFGYKVD